MSVRPRRLNSITAHVRKPDQLKRRHRQFLSWILIDVAHDVSLALAASARAGAPQFFQRNKIFFAITPLHGEFISD